jgi:hypothetical protein
MKPGVMLVAGFVAGVVVTTAVLMTWSAREQARLELERATLQQKLAEAEQAARRDRDTLRNLREELSGLRERGPLVAPTTPVGPTRPGVVPPAGAPSAAAGRNNDAIFSYLGEPVPPPANLDPKYTAEGMTAAFKELCAARGIEIDKLGVDTSEYPYLLYGVVRNGPDFFQQISADLKALPGYAYSGSTTRPAKDGTVTFSLSMVPGSALSREEAEVVQRRKMVRLQMLGAAWDPVR